MRLQVEGSEVVPERPQYSVEPEVEGVQLRAVEELEAEGVRLAVAWQAVSVPSVEQQLRSPPYQPIRR